jgi:hypothetical protein
LLIWFLLLVRPLRPLPRIFWSLCRLSASGQRPRCVRGLGDPRWQRERLPLPVRQHPFVPPSTSARRATAIGFEPVNQNERHVYDGSRWVLYHGTSTARLKRILEDGRLRRATTGDQKIALTTERSVAEYFACNAVFADKHDRPDQESSPVVLVLDGAGLLADNYKLVPFSDPIWGDGECAWENDIECWDDIEPLEEVLMAVEPAPPERYRDFIEHCRVAFKPTFSRIASLELRARPQIIESTFDRVRYWVYNQV